jgi:hypothetical protein
MISNYCTLPPSGPTNMKKWWLRRHKFQLVYQQCTLAVRVDLYILLSAHNSAKPGSKFQGGWGWGGARVKAR